MSAFTDKEMLPKVEEAYRRCRDAYDTSSQNAKLR
jgi:hypothetical protein